MTCANCSWSESHTWPAPPVHGVLCWLVHLKGSALTAPVGVTSVLDWGGARAWAQPTESDAEHCPGAAAQGRLGAVFFLRQVAPGAGRSVRRCVHHTHSHMGTDQPFYQVAGHGVTHMPRCHPLGDCHPNCPHVCEPPSQTRREGEVKASVATASVQFRE